MSEETTTYGIDKIKDVLKAGFDIVIKVEEAKEDDDKVSFLEAAGITAGAIPDVYNAAKNAKLIYNQYKDIDDEEREELIAYFVEEFDLTNDLAEKKIEAVFNWLMVTDATISVILEKDEDTATEETEEE